MARVHRWCNPDDACRAGRRYRYFRVELSEFCVSDTGADAASAHGVRELRLMAVRLYWTGVMEIARDLTDQVCHTEGGHARVGSSHLQ